MLDWPGTDTAKLKKRPSYIESQWVKPVDSSNSNEVSHSPPAHAELAVAQPESAQASCNTEQDNSPFPEIAAQTTNEVLAVISDSPQPVNQTTTSEVPEPLAEATGEMLAGIVGGSGAEILMSLGAALDVLTSSPPVQKPKVKVFTGNVSRGRTC